MSPQSSSRSAGGSRGNGRSYGSGRSRSQGGFNRSGGGYGSRGSSSYGRSRPGGYSRGRPQGGYSRSGGRRGGGRPIARIDVSKFINKAQITEEVPVFVPEHRFEDFAISPELKDAIAKKGYVDPTIIQDRTIPHTLRGEDVVGIADTGSGKTGAFLIPLIDKVLRNQNERVLILAPTRELAVQIDRELQGFSGLRLSSVIAVGGVGIVPQIRGLRRNPSFVIGTPGRVKDLIERKALSLGSFGTVVLDEADRMLDMGFIHDMRQVLALLPEKHHTLFFSATLSKEIDALIGEFLNEPARISVKTGDTSKDVEQDVVRVERGQDKLDVLEGLLRKPEFDKVLVFGRTKYGVEKLAKLLSGRGIKAESIHGNKTQSKRQRALDLFARDHVQVLVATDVAARGIDIRGVSHVINYDLPATDEDYVHRIGRTGRAGKKGVALTFIEGRVSSR